MYSLKLDDKFDIKIEKGKGTLQSINGYKEILQSLRCELVQNTEQYVLRSNYGLDWVNKYNTGISQNKLHETIIENMVKTIVSKHKDVNKLLSVHVTTEHIEVVVLVDGAPHSLKMGGLI